MAKTTEYKKIGSLADITFDDRNANFGTVRGLAMIEDSLRQNGAGRSVLVDRNGKLICGNKTTESAGAIGLENIIVIPTDGTQLVVVQRTDLDLDTDPMARRLAIADNRSGEVGLEWNAEVLSSLSEDVDLSAFWSEDELTAILQAVGGMEFESDEQEAQEARQTLAERFGVPPFSVLDARQGYWQARKRAWLALGIQSEIGRGEGVHQYSEGATLSLDGGSLGMDGSKVYEARNAEPGGSKRPASTLGPDGKTQRGDGHGRPVADNGLLGESQQAVVTTSLRQRWELYRRTSGPEWPARDHMPTEAKVLPVATGRTSCAGNMSLGIAGA